MDPESFEAYGQTLFGRNKLWKSSKPTVTATERRLLNLLAEKFATSAMPPGTAPNPTKKKIRPSSAVAQLQTHPQFSTGLYDSNVRPSTATASTAAGPGQRPRSQAAGGRGQAAAKAATTAAQPAGPPPKPRRRLTVGAVDGIGELEAAKGHKGLSIRSGIRAGERGKVREFYCFILWL